MKKRRTRKIFSLHMKSTLMGVAVLLSLALLGLLCRVYYLQEFEGDRYSREVLAQQTYVSNPILYKRGDIVDRNGTALAVNVKVYDLIIEPQTILNDADNKEFTIATLVSEFGLDRAALEAGMAERAESKYMVIKEKKGLLDEEIAHFNEVKKEAKERANSSKKGEKVPVIVGVWFEERYERRYPLGTTACHVVGFVSGDNGTMGIEQSYNNELTGTCGREYGYFDSELNLERTVKPATDGNTVVSSIDANVQSIVEEKIAGLSESMGAANIAVMMMDPNNGEVLAMASDKSYNLNEPRSLTAYYTDEEIAALSESEIDGKLSEMWKNFCINYMYEPGSTFKSFTVAAAIDEKAATANSSYQCDGEIQVSDYKIGCANRIHHGIVTPRKALMESCNVALMNMAFALGSDRFYKYTSEIYGFGSKTGIDLVGEERGIIHSKDNLGMVELATSSFGQTQKVTMVQMLSGFCSLINGGNYYEPHVVKEIKSAGGSVVEKNRGRVLRQTVTKQTSDFIRNSLRDTVKEGTAKPAAVKGYDIGGKTGTGETREEGGNTSKNDYIVSFIGFAPTDNPQVAIYVLIDRPNVEDQAHSTYATEFAHDIMKATFPFLGIYKENN